MRITLPLLLAGVLFGVSCLPAGAAARRAIDDLGDGAPTGAVADEDVPYGVASSFILGHSLLEEGKAAEALPYLHMAYRAQPDVVAIAADFQAALAAEGYLADALEVVNKMVADNPDSLGFLTQRADLLLKSGQSAEALADLRELRRRDYVTPGVIDAEASILAADGKVEQAEDVYRDGLTLLPDAGPQLYLGLAGTLQRAGEAERIPKVMDEAVSLFPDVPGLWLVWMRVLAIGGHDEEALGIARRADTHFAGLIVSRAVGDSTLAGGEPRAEETAGQPESFVVELADFYAQRQDLDKAMSILRPLSDAGELALAPSLWLARLLLGTDHTEDGESLVARIIEEWPDSGRGWFLQGKAAEVRGVWPEAIASFKQAVDLAPRDPEIRLGYLRAMLVAWEADLTTPATTPEQDERRSEFRRHLLVASTIVPDEDREGQLIIGYGFKAISDFKRAVWRFGLAAEDPDLRLNALLQQSLCYDELGKPGKARHVLEKLHGEFPEDPEVANSLGYFLAEKGKDLDQARELVAQALAAEPGNGAYLDSMGWIAYRTGDLESALDYLIQAVNVLPDDPVVLEHLGMVLKQQGKNVEALAMLRRSLARGGDKERLQGVMDELTAGAADGR